MTRLPANPPQAGMIPSKIRSPRTRDDAVQRDALVDRMLACSTPFIAVHGPPGYGKTTLARQYIDADHRHAAWVTLDPGDNDPVVLLNSVIRALNEIGPMPGLVLAIEGRRPS